jgi:hypothetical protein
MTQDISVTTTAAMMKAALEAYKETHTWHKPNQEHCNAIDGDSTPKFVAVRGGLHRLTADIEIPQWWPIPEVRVTEDGGMEVSMTIKNADDESVFDSMKTMVGEGRRVLAFFPTWGKDTTDDPEERIDVTGCVLHFSEDEIARLLEYETDGSHLVLCVMPQTSEVEDMALCDSAPYESFVAGDDRRPAFMALRWDKLKNKDAFVFVDPIASREWAEKKRGRAEEEESEEARGAKRQRV